MFLSVAYHAYIWLWFPCGFKLITLRCPPVIKRSNGKSKTYMERHSSLGKSSVNWPCSIPRKLPEVFFSRETASAFFTSKKDWSKGDVGGPSPISTGAAQSLYSAPQFLTAAATQLAVLSSHAPDPFAKATFIFNHPIFMTSWCIKKLW